MRSWVAPGLLLLTAMAAPQDPPPDSEALAKARRILAAADAARETPWDLEHAALDLSLGLDPMRLEGTARLVLRTAAPATQVELLLRGPTVREVSADDGAALEHAVADGRLTVTLPGEVSAEGRITLVVALEITGAAGFLRATAEEPGGPLLLAPPGPDGAAAWCPVGLAIQDRATLAVDLDVPSVCTTLAPGGLHDSRREEGRRMESWRLELPVPPEEWFLGVGARERLDLGMVGERRLSAWVRGRSAADAAAWLADTGRTLEALEQRFGGPGPLPSFTVVVAEDLPAPGQVGAGALFVLPEALDPVAVPPPDLGSMVCRSLARQWWGLQGVPGGQEDRWLVAGLAAYSEVLALEDLGLADQALARLVALQEQAVKAWKDRPFALGDATDRGAPEEELAAGGAAALHLLRHTVGGAAFFPAVSDLAADAGHGPLTGQGFLDRVAQTSGQDLHAFADRWLRSAGWPDLVGRWSYDESTHELEIQVQQVQAQGASMELGTDLVVSCQGPFGRRRFRVPLEERHVEVRVPCPEEPDFVNWNEDLALPRFAGTQPEQRHWHHALQDGTQESSRWQAARALGDPTVSGPSPSVEDLGALAVAACADPSSAVRAEAMQGMGLSRDPVVLSAGKSVLLDDAPRVRMAAAGVLGAQRGVSAAAGLLLDRLGSETDPAVQEVLLEQVAATGVQATDTILGQIADADTLPEVLRGAALKALALRDPAGAQRRLRAFLEGAPPLRRAALETMRRLQRQGSDVTRLLGRQLESGPFSDQGLVLTLLGGVGDATLLPRLVRYHDQCPFESLRQGTRRLIRTLLPPEAPRPRLP